MLIIVFLLSLVSVVVMKVQNCVALRLFLSSLALLIRAVYPLHVVFPLLVDFALFEDAAEVVPKF